jgi:hypothetical protein
MHATTELSGHGLTARKTLDTLLPHINCELGFGRRHFERWELESMALLCALFATSIIEFG